MLAHASLFNTINVLQVPLNFFMLVTLVTADYECLCNYETQYAVQSEPNATAKDIGTLYEFDCKPTYKLAPNTPKSWQAVQYENKVGYVHLNDKTSIQTCPGKPSKGDIVIATTTVKPSSISMNITMAPSVFSLLTTTSLPTLPSSVSSGLSNSSYRPIISTNGTTNSAPYSPSSILTNLLSNHTTPRTNGTTNPITTSTTPRITHPYTTATLSTTAPTTPLTTRTTILTTARTSTSIRTTDASTKRATTITTKTSKPTTYPVTFEQTTTAHTTPTSSVLTHPSTVPTGSFSTQTTTKRSTTLQTITKRKTTTLITRKRPTTTKTTTKRPTTTKTPKRPTITNRPTTTKTTAKRPTTTQTITKRPTTTQTSAKRPTTPSKRTTTIVATTTKVMEPHCPPQVKLRHGVYLEHNNRCYEFIKTPQRTWPDAEHDCNTGGGHLVSVESIEEQSWIHTELWRKGFHNDHVWIGLTDTYGDWKWSSGESLMFTFWAPGEPNGRFEHCALLQMEHIGHWADYHCSPGFLLSSFKSQKHGYVCEYSLV